jgi:hypothetical protein
VTTVKTPKKLVKIKTLPMKNVPIINDKYTDSVKDIVNELSMFKNEETYVCLQDCFKKLSSIRKDNGY